MVAFTITAVGIPASQVPARRATRAEPVAGMRQRRDIARRRPGVTR
jgi:hypothetical protein